MSTKQEIIIDTETQQFKVREIRESVIGNEKEILDQLFIEQKPEIMPFLFPSFHETWSSGAFFLKAVGNYGYWFHKIEWFPMKGALLNTTSEGSTFLSFSAEALNTNMDNWLRAHPNYKYIEDLRWWFPEEWDVFFVTPVFNETGAPTDNVVPRIVIYKNGATQPFFHRKLPNTHDNGELCCGDKFKDLTDEFRHNHPALDAQACLLEEYTDSTINQDLNYVEDWNELMKFDADGKCIQAKSSEITGLSKLDWSPAVQFGELLPTLSFYIDRGSPCPEIEKLKAETVVQPNTEAPAPAPEVEVSSEVVEETPAPEPSANDTLGQVITAAVDPEITPSTTTEPTVRINIHSWSA